MKELVFVDCDRTLVNTEVYPFLSRHLLFDRRKHKFFFQWRQVVTEPRPSAREFLEKLRQNYRVEILSLGHSHFQTRVLTELGLIDLVEKIWGPDNCNEIPKPENFVLIDDMAGESLGIAYKMTWLGRRRSLINLENWGKILNTHFIQCRPFTGGVQDEQPLVDFLPVIDNLLAKQVAADQIAVQQSVEATLTENSK